MVVRLSLSLLSLLAAPPIKVSSANDIPSPTPLGVSPPVPSAPRMSYRDVVSKTAAPILSTLSYPAKGKESAPPSSEREPVPKGKGKGRTPRSPVVAFSPEGKGPALSPVETPSAELAAAPSVGVGVSTRE